MCGKIRYNLIKQQLTGGKKMTIETYTQGRKLQNHIARIGQFDWNTSSPDFGKYFLDIVKEYGTSRNNHEIEPTNDITIIQKWLDKNGFIKIEID